MGIATFKIVGAPDMVSIGRKFLLPCSSRCGGLSSRGCPERCLHLPLECGLGHNDRQEAQSFRGLAREHRGGVRRVDRRGVVNDLRVGGEEMPGLTFPIQRDAQVEHITDLLG
jgi:hypothetical protein